jgi:hypothetical protein
MRTQGRSPTLFTFGGTPIKTSPLVLANIVGLWGGLTWLAGRRHPERSWPIRLLIGALSTITLFVADIGHAMAHTVSARHAGAPMDEILISEGMPRTVYMDDDVSPQAHRTRALGGPIYSAVGLLISLLLRLLIPRGSVAREVVEWSCIGHGLILGGSLAPLPIVDGGSILKWTLVEQGKTPEEADAVVKQANMGLGVAATTASVGLAAKRRWLPALGLLAVGAAALAAALGKLR